MPEALELTVTAPVVSFRNPLYDGLQVGLPCPPPSTVGGMLAAAAGGWDCVPDDTRFAMAFHAAGAGRDLETYHPLGSPGTPTNVTSSTFGSIKSSSANFCSVFSGLSPQGFEFV